MGVFSREKGQSFTYGFGLPPCLFHHDLFPLRKSWFLSIGIRALSETRLEVAKHLLYRFSYLRWIIFFPSIVWYGCFTIQNHKKIDACFLLLKRDFEWRKSGVCCLQRKWLLFFFSIYGNRGIIRTVVSDLLWKQSYMRWIKETHFLKRKR